MTEELPAKRSERLRRSTTNRFVKNLTDSPSNGGSSGNALAMVELGRYDPASRHTQPYTLVVHPWALVIPDFHSHLALEEIIGFLAGSWDPVSKVIVVEAAFPCRALDRAGTGGTSLTVTVEMDPASELAVREEISARSLSIVGWYHSHPIFPPIPSVRDVENQANYQGLFADVDSSTEPFVGLIVSPYDLALTTPECSRTWFHAARSSAWRGHKAMALESQPPTPEATTTNPVHSQEFVVDQLRALVDVYRPHRARVSLLEPWRLGSATARAWPQSGHLGLDSEEDIQEKGNVIVSRIMRRVDKVHLALDAVADSSGINAREWIQGVTDHLWESWTA